MEVSKADEAEGNEADGRADAGNGKAEVGMVEDGTYGAADEDAAPGSGNACNDDAPRAVAPHASETGVADAPHPRATGREATPR